VTSFWEKFLEYFQKKSSKSFKVFFKISLCYFLKVCVENLLEMCHLQSFPSPFTNPFTLKNNGYKSFYPTFENSNVNEIISYFRHL
jgi:hypothetical protein